MRLNSSELTLFYQNKMFALIFLDIFLANVIANNYSRFTSSDLINAGLTPLIWALSTEIA